MIRDPEIYTNPALNARLTRLKDRRAALSHRSTERGFSGLFALLGDTVWRACRDANGLLVWHKTAAEAEADAAHRMVAALNATPI